MKKVMLSFLLVGLYGSLIQGSLVPLIGKISNLYPFMQKNLPLLYKGHALSLSASTQPEAENKKSSATFALLDYRSMQKMHILISDDIAVAGENNTVQYLYLTANAEYTLYTLQAKRELDEAGEVLAYSWDITSDSLPPFQPIPENTLIVWVTPHLIDAVQPRSWDPGKSTRLLPELFCKQGYTEKEVQEFLDKSQLRFLDIRALHQTNNRSQILPPEACVCLLEM